MNDIKEDLYRILSLFPEQGTYLLTQLEQGNMDGRTYIGKRSCVIGTLLRGRHGTENIFWNKDFREDLGAASLLGSPCPLESYFQEVRPKETPENNERVANVHHWTYDWLADKGLLK